MAQYGADINEDLVLLDVRIKQLRTEYEQYFLGSRKREPQLLRGDVNKMVMHYANVPIQNTGYRFKFNNLRARYFAFKRYWDMTCRKIEEGRYERHLFKAKLHDGKEGAAPTGPKGVLASEANAGGDDLFEDFRAARLACGLDAKNVTREKLDSMLARQEAAIRERTGCDQVRFRVVVQDGKPKLKATPVRG
jgi:hypothetical protein